MKLKPEQIKKLSRIIYNKLVQEQLLTVLSSDAIIIDKIEKILLADAHIEEDIEAEAKKMMEKYRSQVESGEIDYHKMYTMIKKQIMKEKKFIS